MCNTQAGTTQYLIILLGLLPLLVSSIDISIAQTFLGLKSSNWFQGS